MNNFTIKNDILSVTVSALGAELYSVKVQGKEMLWQGDPAFWAGRAPILFPSCGAMRESRYLLNENEYNMPFHGFARKCYFELVSKGDDFVTLKLIKSQEYLQLYPFGYEFLITYSIKSNQLVVKAEVVNTSDDCIYFAYGSHESFNLFDKLENYSLQFEREEHFLSNKVEGGLLSYDTIDFGRGKTLKISQDLFEYDTLILRNVNSRKVTLSCNDKRVIDFEFDAPNLLVWQAKGAPYLCIEPWFKAPDFVDSPFEISKKSGIIKVEGKDKFLSTHTITYFD